MISFVISLPPKVVLAPLLTNLESEKRPFVAVCIDFPCARVGRNSFSNLSDELSNNNVGTQYRDSLRLGIVPEVVVAPLGGCARGGKRPDCHRGHNYMRGLAMAPTQQLDILGNCQSCFSTVSPLETERKISLKLE